MVTARSTQGGRTWVGLSQIPLTVLHGVGERRAEALEILGLRTVADLLTHYPRKYLDRTRQAVLSELGPGEEATLLATVRRVNARRARTGRSVVEVDLSDGTGYVRATFFNQPWRSRQLTPGTEAVLFGRIDLYRGRRQITNPVVDLVGTRTGRVIPVYPTSEKAGVSTWELAEWMSEAIERAGTFADPVPGEWLRRLGLPGRTEAMHAVHMPESLEAAEAGRRRLAFDELFRLQLVLVDRKRATERDTAGIEHAVGRGPDSLLGLLGRHLPFALTGAQERAIDAIVADLASPAPMHRLLQGDVGAGKTVVALMAMLAAIQGGHQAALMAPTEVLAEQHHLGLSSLLNGLEVPDAGRLGGSRPLRVALLTHRTVGAERTRVVEGLRNGQVDLVVGTHALLTDDVGFASLGVVVVDEQHRFGVEQRAMLRAKAPGSTVPDVLVMTATPIPRTAAMTVYGDLDVTVLDELPEGRTPVTTRWLRGTASEAWERVRIEVGAGRRAYVVCPLVEGSERVEARSATEELQRLGCSELAALRLGLLHGQLPGREKEAVMARFRSGEIDVLVATTVVEVGVDVPDATVMVVEDADRFGLAQLHQLRGRVGRGAWESWCFLLSQEEPTPEAAKRLAALERSTDGFYLAEVDLDLRGEGTILGVRQQGRSDLKLASLARDLDLVSQAREAAFDLVDASSPGGTRRSQSTSDGDLDGPPPRGESTGGTGGLDRRTFLPGHPVLAEEVRLFVGAGEEEFLFKS